MVWAVQQEVKEVQYLQKVMSQKLNFYNTNYTEMRHLGATLISKNTVCSEEVQVSEFKSRFLRHWKIGPF